MPLSAAFAGPVIFERGTLTIDFQGVSPLPDAVVLVPEKENAPAEGTDAKSDKEAGADAAREPSEPLDLEVLVYTQDYLISDIIVNRPFDQGTGVYVVFDAPQIASVPLEYVFISRDILFIDDTGTVVEIIENAPSSVVEPLTSRDVVKALLQLNAGDSAAYHIRTGDQVTLRLQQPQTLQE